MKTISWEYNLPGTLFDSLSSVTVEARFDRTETGENGDGSLFEKWELTEFEVISCDKNNINQALENLFVYVRDEKKGRFEPGVLTSVLKLIERECYVQREK